MHSQDDTHRPASPTCSTSASIVAAADLTTFRWSPTTPTPGATTAVVTPNVPLSAAVSSVVVVVILTSIFVVCCLRTAKKRRELQLAYPSVPRYTPGIRIIRPSNHRGVERENPQINTRGNSFIPQSDVTCNHGGVESRVDEGSVNDGYDPATDSPPPYVSVVADPKLVIHQDNSQEPPPSYEEVLAATRPPSAPSDAHVTSPDSMTSQKENTSQEPNTTLA